MAIGMQANFVQRASIIRLAALVCVISCSAATALSQIDTVSGDVDQLLRIARDTAAAGGRAEARRICEAILRRTPDYVDVRVLLARTYAWDGMRSDARRELQTALKNAPSNKDALNALVDVEVWDGRFEEALLVTDRALHSYPADDELLFKKARLLHLLEQDREAVQVLDALNRINPEYPGASDLRRSITAASAMSTIGAGYAVDRYSNLYGTMHYANLEFSRRSSGGTLFLRLNYSYRFRRDGFQYELDFYPRIEEGLYGYLNYGYSASILFPKHRIGAELYTRLPLSLEASVGIRSFYFDASRSVKTLTGSINWYAGSYMLTARPYFGAGDLSPSFSMSLFARKYFEDSEHYAYAKLAAGFTPDERLIQTSEGFGGKEIFSLKSQTAGVGIYWLLNGFYFVNLSLDYTNQELSFSRGEYVTFVTLGAILKVKL